MSTGPPPKQNGGGWPGRDRAIPGWHHALRDDRRR